MRLVWEQGTRRDGTPWWRSATRKLPLGVEVISYRSRGSGLERTIRFRREINLGLVRVSYLRARRAWWAAGRPWRWSVGVTWRGDRFSMNLRPRWPFDSFNHSRQARMEQAEREQPDPTFEDEAA